MIIKGEEYGENVRQGELAQGTVIRRTWVDILGQSPPFRREPRVLYQNRHIPVTSLVSQGLSQVQNLSLHNLVVLVGPVIQILTDI